MWGYNYQPDRTQERDVLETTGRTSTCASPAGVREEQVQHLLGRAGLLSGPVLRRGVRRHSPESWWSSLTKPNRLQQISWTNPFTSRLLFEAGLSITAQHYDTTHSRDFVNPQNIPAITEVGHSRRSGDEGELARVNNFAGEPFLALTSRLAELGSRRRLEELRNTRQLPHARISLLYHRQPQRQDRVQRRLLHAQADQQPEQPAPGVQVRRSRQRPALPRCRGSTTWAGRLVVRQHDACITRRAFPNDPFNAGLRPGQLWR